MLTNKNLTSLNARKANGEKAGDLAREVGVSVQKLMAELKKFAATAPVEVKVVEGDLADSYPVGCPSPEQVETLTEMFGDPEEARYQAKLTEMFTRAGCEERNEPAPVEADVVAAKPTAPVAAPVAPGSFRWLKLQYQGKDLWLTDKQLIALRVVAEAETTLPAAMFSQLKKKNMVEKVSYPKDTAGVIAKITARGVEIVELAKAL